MNRNGSSAHGISALSMSLQQRQFHVPAVRPAVQEVREPTPDDGTDDSSDPTHPHTPQMRQHTLDDAAALPFVRRNLDWNADVSTSVRIKSILSQDRPPKQPKKKIAPVAASLPALALQPAPGVVPGTGSSVPPVSPKRASVIKTNGGTPERDRTRRKVVTFGEQPEVKVIDATPTPGAETLPPPTSVVEEHIEEGKSPRFGSWLRGAHILYVLQRLFSILRACMRTISAHYRRLSVLRLCLNKHALRQMAAARVPPRFSLACPTAHRRPSIVRHHLERTLSPH